MSDTKTAVSDPPRDRATTPSDRAGRSASRAATWRRRLRALVPVSLLLPVAQMICPFLNDPPLSGVEPDTRPIVWSVGGWLDGSLATTLDQRVRRGIGFRPASVRVVNQLRLALDLPDCLGTEHKVVMGKENWLYERIYLPFYQDPRPMMTDDDRRQLVAELKALQEKLAARGTTFVLVISPSKCEVYPEYLPDEVVAARVPYEGRTDYQSCVEELTAAGVNFIDGPAIFRRCKGEVDQLFSRTGVHWSYHGAFLVWRELLAKVNEVSDLRLPIPELVGTEYARARHADHDLGRLINAYVVPGGRPRLPYPVVKADPLPFHDRPNFLFVGSSFCWTLMDSLYVSQSAREVDIFYYNRTHYRTPDGDRPRYPGQVFERVPVCSLEEESPDWRRALMQKDVVVMEMIEFGFVKKGWGFCGPALQALETWAHEPPRRRPPTRLARAAASRPSGSPLPSSD
jgi:hypothetical protein